MFQSTFPSFWQKKRQILTSLAQERYADKSIKSTLDTPIVDVIDAINKKDCYVTTSSCSGRVVLHLRDDDPGSENTGNGIEHIECENRSEKVERTEAVSGELEPKRTRKKKTKPGRWLYVSHCPPEPGWLQHPDSGPSSWIVPATASASATTTLKFEPFILHILCSSLPAAVELQALAFSLGLRHTGIIIPASLRRPPLVAVRTDLKIEAPVVRYGRVVANEEYRGVLESTVVEKFRMNSDVIGRFRCGVQAL